MTREALIQAFRRFCAVRCIDVDALAAAAVPNLPEHIGCSEPLTDEELMACVDGAVAVEMELVKR